MTTTLKMELFSRREICARSAAQQIEFLSKFDGGRFRPTRCDTSEPPREKFDPDHVDVPAKWLSEPGTDFQFKQMKPLQIEGFISNRKRRQLFTREQKGGPLVPIIPKFPEPLLTTHWVVWFKLKAPGSGQLGTLRQFLTEAFLVSESEYGYLAEEEDQKSKNFLVTVAERVTTTRFIGNDPEHGIPGLYWLNIFGPTYTKWFGSALSDIPAAVQPLPNGSTLIQFGGSPQDWRDENVVANQRATKNLLGGSRFFEIAAPDKVCDTPFSSS
jgi:hypothetical protein